MKCELAQYEEPETDDEEDIYELVLLEEEALRQADKISSDPDPHPDDPHPDDLRESARMLKEARLLRPRLRAIFALRALCHRGRAAPTFETPEGFARLIGSPASQPKTRAAAKVPSSPGLPDPLAQLVCQFWLGEPPRRRSAATATE